MGISNWIASPEKGGVYIDKQRKEIEKDVRRRFDKKDNFFIRDDQEIYNAGLYMIKEYMDEVLDSDRLVNKERFIVGKDGKPILFEYQNKYWKAAKKYFIEAYEKIADLHDNVTGLIKFTTDAEDNDLIRKVAIEIDNAENEALRKIEQYCNPMQEGDNLSYRATLKKDEKGIPIVKDGQIETEKPMFVQDKKGVITFTDRCNNISFVNMANTSGLFYLTKKKQYPQYTIDYTNCKNQKLKDKIKNSAGGYKGTLYYDTEQKIYFIKGIDGNVVKASSIGIWEGVTFRRKEIEADEAHEKNQKRNEDLGKLNIAIDSTISPENDPELKKYVEDIPETLRTVLRELGPNEYRRFIIETENRLAKILGEHKRYNYELHTNPLSGSSSGLFEINFISRDYEISVDLRDDGDKKLGSKLFSLFQNTREYSTGYTSNADLNSDYKKYLEKRISEKWNELDELASRVNLIGMDYVRNPNLREDEKLSPEKVNSINYGIYLLKTFIQNHRNNEGNSYIDNDDRNLTGMLENLQNLESTIKSDFNLVPKYEIYSVIDEVLLDLTTRWYNYTGGVVYKKYISTYFKSIIESDDNNEKFNSLRRLSLLHRYFGSADGTTTFLAEEMSKSDVKETNFINENGKEEHLFYAESRLEINDTELNERFRNINAYLYAEIDFDGDGNLKRTLAMDKIDKLYKCCHDTSGKEIAKELKNMGILPDSWVENSDVLDKCKEIAKTLQTKENNINKNFTVENVKKGISDQRLKLESKYPRTPEEDEELRRIKYFDEYPEEAEIYYKESLECMKSTLRYYGINNEIACSLASVFVEEGGGAKGKMGEMYNDIIGYGFWDLSDKTAAIVENIIMTIIVSALAGLAISSVVSLLGAYLAEHFPGLIKIIESIKSAVSTKVSKCIASIGGIKGKMIKAGVEILKNYKFGLIGVKNSFVSNFRAGIPLDGGFGLNHHALDSILLMSIAYLSGVVGQFGQLFGDKISNCLESVFKKFAENPERGDKVVDMTGTVTELASKEGLKSIKNMILLPGKDEVVFESDFKNGLNSLNENIRSSDDKLKLSESAESKIKFHLSTDIIDDSTVTLNGDKKLINAVDLMSVVQNLLAFKFVKRNAFDDCIKKIENGTLKLHLSTVPGKVYLHDTNTGKIASISDVSNGKEVI